MSGHVSHEAQTTKVEPLALNQLNCKKIGRHSDHASDMRSPYLAHQLSWYFLDNTHLRIAHALENRMVHTRRVLPRFSPQVEVIPYFLLVCIDVLASYEN
jgi:hypothetical protein